jgi:hypothetical protein
VVPEAATSGHILSQGVGRKPMKKIYIAHPLRGDRPGDPEAIRENERRVGDICRSLSETHPDHLILSPVHAFGFVDATGPQEWVLSQCRMLLALADELWVFGRWWTSEGCRMEVAAAKNMGIPVRLCGESVGDASGDA